MDRSVAAEAEIIGATGAPLIKNVQDAPGAIPYLCPVIGIDFKDNLIFENCPGMDRLMRHVVQDLVKREPWGLWNEHYLKTTTRDGA